MWEKNSCPEIQSEWEKFYGLGWEFKFRLLKKYHGRIRFPIKEDEILELFEKEIARNMENHKL